MSARSTRLGFLYPGYAAEDDYPWMAERLEPPAEAVVVHTSVGEDAHRPDALLDLGSSRRLLEGAARLRDHESDAAVWACTSGSFVFGWAGAQEQVAELSEQLGIPCSSTSFSFVAAARALDVHRVAVAATYPNDVAELFAAFLSAGGIDVVGLGSHDIMTAEEVGTLDEGSVLGIARSYDRPDAEAVLLPDTALHSVRWLEALERTLGKPVITANQATIWHAWGLAGRFRPVEGLGALLRTTAPGFAVGTA